MGPLLPGKPLESRTSPTNRGPFFQYIMLITPIKLHCKPSNSCVIAVLFGHIGVQWDTKSETTKSLKINVSSSLQHTVISLNLYSQQTSPHHVARKLGNGLPMSFIRYPTMVTLQLNYFHDKLQYCLLLDIDVHYVLRQGFFHPRRW